MNHSKYHLLDGIPGFARIPKRKINQEFKKYVTRLGFEPATSCVAIGYSNYLAIDQKEKTNQEFKKKIARLGYEHPSSCVAGGKSNHLAIDMSCERNSINISFGKVATP